MGFFGWLMSRAAMMIKGKPAGQPDAAGHPGAGDLVSLFEMSGEQEAWAIVDALEQRGVYPEEIVVVGFERVTVKVARRDLESGKHTLMQIRGEFPRVDWAKVEIASQGPTAPG
ncbi:MAG: hypothetical protein ACKO4Z_03885 [Planctomycetota bacterium]